MQVLDANGTTGWVSAPTVMVMGGISVLPGSHVELTRELMEALENAGARDMPVVVGGIIPKADHAVLAALGVRRVFTPSDYQLVEVMEKIMDVIDEAAAA